MAKKPEDHKQDNQILENYLQGGSDLSKVYGAEQKAQVPAHLDEAILSAANEAVKPEKISKLAYSPFARSWYVPASMAAVLMLCVGLVFTIYKDSGQTLLTAPKSEYDIDEAIIEERPASKGLLREEIIEMEDAFQSAPGDRGSFKRDAAKQTMSDSPYLPERFDASGLLEAADVKKQEQIDGNILNNKPSEMELKANDREADVGASSALAPALRYRNAKESLPGEDELLQGKFLKKEISDDDMDIERNASPTLSVGNKIMSPEQWLKQINDLWLSGDHQGAKENLNQFFAAYPGYPVESAKNLLDSRIDLREYTD